MLIQFQVKNFGAIKDTQTLSMEASLDTDLEDYYVCKINKLRILKLAVSYGTNASGKKCYVCNVIRFSLNNSAVDNQQVKNHKTLHM